MPKSSAPQQDSVRLSHYVKDAIELQKLLAGWEADSIFLALGGSLLYSVDADTISLYLAPSEEGPAKKVKGKTVRYGYTEVFRYDKPSISAALGDGVCDAVFFDKTERAMGTILLSHLQDELSDIYHALVGKARRLQQSETRIFREDEALRSALESSTTTDAEKYQYLKKRVPGIAAHFFEDKGPYAQLERLHSLARNSRLTELQRYIDLHDQDGSLDGLRIGDRFEDWVVLSAIKRRLSKSMASLKGEKRADADAEAIARLAIMNCQMSRDKVRIVHVTGDRTLFGVASTIPAHCYLDGWQNSEDLAKKTFAEAFLRHPSSFLAAPDAFPELPYENLAPKEGIAGLLEFFLSQFEIGSDLPDHLLLDRCRSALATYPNALNEFEKKWHQFVDPLLIKRVEAAAQRRAPKDWSSSLDKLSDYIDDEFERSWMRCIETALSTGFNFVLQPRSKSSGPARDVPLIWFDCEQTADHALATLQQSLLLRGNSDRSDDGSTDYQEAILKLQAMDETGYFHFVTFAVLFAGSGRWDNTLMLADHAIGIAERVMQQQADTERKQKEAKIGRAKAKSGALTNISGREAFYVASIATRVGASSPQQFEAAATLLQQAFDALDTDVAFLKGNNEPYLRYLTPVRFQSEEIALELAKYLFARFVPGEKALQAIPAHDFFQQVRGLLGLAAREEDADIRESLRRRLLVNLFGRFLHDDAWRKEVERAPEQAEALRALLAEMDAAGSGDGENTAERRLQKSYLRRVVSLAANFELNPPASSKKRKMMESEAFRLFGADIMKRNKIAVYDTARFQELAQICGIASTDRRTATGHRR